MNQKKFEVKGCPTGLNASWDQFPWEQYPGGVDVTFALASGRRLYLAKEGRHCYVMPKASLKRGQVIANLVSQVFGVSRRAEVCASYDDSCTLHLLVLVEHFNSAGYRELNNDPLLLSGYVTDVMAAYAARVLGWSEAETDRYLPLPPPKVQTEPVLALAA